MIYSEPATDLSDPLTEFLRAERDRTLECVQRLLGADIGQPLFGFYSDHALDKYLESSKRMYNSWVNLGGRKGGFVEDDEDVIRTAVLLDTPSTFRVAPLIKAFSARENTSLEVTLGYDGDENGSLVLEGDVYEYLFGKFGRPPKFSSTRSKRGLIYIFDQNDPSVEPWMKHRRRFFEDYLSGDNVPIMYRHLTGQIGRVLLTTRWQSLPKDPETMAVATRSESGPNLQSILGLGFNLHYFLPSMACTDDPRNNVLMFVLMNKSGLDFLRASDMVSESDIPEGDQIMRDQIGSSSYTVDGTLSLLRECNESEIFQQDWKRRRNAYAHPTFNFYMDELEVLLDDV